MILKTVDERVYLKLIEMKDAEKIFKLTHNSRNYLRKWLPWVDTTTGIEDTKAFIRACISKYDEDKHMIMMVILYKDDVVGVAGYNQIDWLNKTAYIGYWLAEECQGFGIMTKVVKALTNYAFTEAELKKVAIRPAENNEKSRAIPERLGFIEECRVSDADWIYDHSIDHIVYSITKKSLNN
ncbi:GNAT family protein [Bacillus sp. SM2101]|uniref:GNAT family N-acetyltransferase n=1 Tax=Bacillus sp. SM2101 TaxID=2805366 RepID=UPI001BDED2B6|nr:GNAT family protein [Bacillus sp. SM2101]